MRRTLAFCLLCLAAVVSLTQAGQPQISGSERLSILSHGPWPPPLARDASNEVSGKIEAVAFGERLFFEPRLSGTGSVLCASCHVPYRAWQDGKPRAFGLQTTELNTPSLFNVRFNRRFGWDGAHHSLASQSLRPLLEPREMRSSASRVADFVRNNAAYRRGYEKTFSRPTPANDGKLLEDVGKALAAFQETLVSGRTPFDEFRDALARGDAAAMARYPADALAGLKVFVAQGCGACHAGPRFSNGELAGTGAGAFRIPGLRNAALTAPYMHDGHVPDLEGAVGHASRALSAPQAARLASFLRSLSSPELDAPAR
jgi:cytochrome c peroxidase